MPAVDYAAFLHAPPAWVFKQDRRSRVWQVETDAGPLVYKRFQYSPTRQLFAKLLGVHPGQRELAAAEQLRGMGFPVVPILAHGTQKSPLGVMFWLVTPYIGHSVQEMGKQAELEHPKQRKHVIDHIAVLTAELILRGWYNRDHKTSNLLFDKHGKIWMIDVGGAQPAKKGRPQTLRMLAMLNKTLAKDEIPPAERQYLFDMIRQRCDFLGPLDKLLVDIETTKLPRG